MFIPNLLSTQGTKIANFLFRGVREKLSSNKIINTLKQYGESYRRQNMLSDIRLYRVAWEKTEAIQHLPNHIIPSKDYFIEAKKVTIPRRYLYTYHETKIDLETGESSESFHTYATDILETKNDVKFQMQNQSILSKYYVNIKIEVSEVVECYLGGKE